MCKKAVWMQLPLLASSYVPESTASSLATYMYILMICLCECDAVDSGGRTQTTDSTWAKQSGGRKMSPASCRLDQSAACCKFDDVVIDVTLSCVYTIGHMLPLAWKHVSRQLIKNFYEFVKSYETHTKSSNKWAVPESTMVLLALLLNIRNIMPFCLNTHLGLLVLSSNVPQSNMGVFSVACLCVWVITNNVSHY